MRDVLAAGLGAEGFEVSQAASAAEALAALDAQPVDLITLDLGLGDGEGLDLAREIRTRHNVPVVMVTGRAMPFDRVTGLEHGADDYVIKPFLMREVVIRVRRVLARYGAPGHTDEPPDPVQRYGFDASVLDLRRRTLRRGDGAFAELTGAEFRLLELFLTHAGCVLSRDELSRAVNGRDWSPLDRTVDGHVARLRRKIEEPGDEPRMIRSVRGVGYVFAGDVWTLPPSAGPSAADTALASASRENGLASTGQAPPASSPPVAEGR